jgi:hypothetical protein
MFRRVREVAKSDYQLHVRPSVRYEEFGSHWTDFHENLDMSTFRKSVDKSSSFIKI